MAVSWRRLRRIDRSIIVRDRDVALLRNVPMLEVLPLPAVEQLARRLRPVTVRAGATVFEQGDTGDRFYVPRTATVRALADLQLQVLSGQTFILMVTCFPPSVRESEQFVGERLDRFSPGDGDGRH